MKELFLTPDWMDEIPLDAFLELEEVYGIKISDIRIVEDYRRRACNPEDPRFKLELDDEKILAECFKSLPLKERNPRPALKFYQKLHRRWKH